MQVYESPVELWTLSPDDKMPVQRGTTKLQLKEHQSTRLATLAYSLVANGCPSTAGPFMSLTQHVVHPLQPSKTWYAKFLEGVGLRWKSTQTGDKTRFTQDAIAASQRCLKLKLWWLMTQKGVALRHVSNVDETFVRLIPSPNRAWRSSTETTPAMTLPTDKASYTVTVAISATWRAEWMVQHICKAKTGTVLPGPLWPKEFGIVHSFIPEAPLEIHRGNGGARLPKDLAARLRPHIHQRGEADHGDERFPTPYLWPCPRGNHIVQPATCSHVFQNL